MDVINLLVGINLFVTLTANLSGAKKGLKSTLSEVIERPKTHLQKSPLNASALVLILEIVGVFQLGTYNIESDNQFFTIRVMGLLVFFIFSWLQVWSYKTLGTNYSQEIIVSKKQSIVKTGPYKFVRHPQYISQLLSDLGAGVALLSYLVVPVTLFVLFPLFLMRAVYEEKLLIKHYGGEFEEYKKRTGFIIPFIG